MIWVFGAGVLAGALAGAVIMGLCAARQDEARVRELERLTRFCDECAHWDYSCSKGNVILLNPDEIVVVPMCADFVRREEEQEWR